MTSPDLAIVLARLEVKLDQTLAASGDHEVRIRRLEERRWPLPVASAVCATLALVATLMDWVLE